MTPLDLNIRHLRAVAAVVETGSISAATRRVNLTQPAITQGLAKLERLLGLKLFQRASGGMVPTEAAAILAPRVQAALRLMAVRHATAPQISAFLAVARAGGYAAAAKARGLSEASLHRAVADLSWNLNQTLVERRGRSLILTQRGQAVARRLRLGLSELDQALAELDALKGREVGRIVVGAMPLSRARLLPQAVTAFHAARPEVDLAIIEGSRAELIGPLRDGELDLLVGALRLPPAEEDIVQTPLFVDRPVILGRVGHPLAARGGALRPGDLERYPWIVPGEATPLRAQWRSMFAATGAVPPKMPPRVPIECGSVLMVRQMLMGSDFLTLLSPDQVAVELEAGWLTRIAEAPGDVSRTIGITTRADWRPTRTQAAFLEALKDQGRILTVEP